MTMQTDLTTPGLTQLADLWQTAPAACAAALQAAMQEAVLMLQAEVVDATPAAFGTLRQSIHSDVSLGEQRVDGYVGTALAYAQPVEMGSKPHWAPIAPLIDWVIQKVELKPAKARRDGSVPDQRQQAQAIARAIQAQIAARGTQPVLMFKTSYDRLLPAIQQLMAEAAARVAADLKGAVS